MGVIPACFRHVLAGFHVALGARHVAHTLFHGDALSVVAVGEDDAVVALHDLDDLVERGVGDDLIGEDTSRGIGDHIAPAEGVVAVSEGPCLACADLLGLAGQST